MQRFFTWGKFWSFLKDALSVIGAFGVIVTMTSFFDQLKSINDILKSSLSLLTVLVIAVIWGVVNNRPRTRFEYRLDNKDIRMQLVIGDILGEHGSVIVPINNEFDVSLGGSVVRSGSIKAQVIEKFFNGDSKELGDKLKNKLKNNIYNGLKDGTCYKIGTTVTVEQGDKKFYFSANSRKINKSRVMADEEDLVPTLSGIWEYLANYGAKENIVIPLLGTGNGRLGKPRGEVFKDIVRSFVASCSEKSYCEKLTIVIRPEDVEQYEIDIEELNEFLCLNCKYATFVTRQSPRVGAPA